MKIKERDLIIVGLGPAGVAAGLQANATNRFRTIEAIDPSPTPGGGSLAGVDTQSNSQGRDFVAGYDSLYPKVLRQAEAAPLIGNEGLVNLSLATRFLRSVARSAISDQIIRHTPEVVTRIVDTPNGYHVLTAKDHFVAPEIVAASGGVEKIISDLQGHDPTRTFTSAEILSNARGADLKNALIDIPVIVIVGNSHGAYSVANKLLEKYPSIKVHIYKKSETKPYFENIEEAYSYGYVPSPESICPDTGKINRFDGIRGRARELWFKEEQGALNGRLTSHYDVPLETIDPRVAVVQATGYTARDIPLFHEDETPITYETTSVEDGYADVIVDNRPLARVHALGIGHSKHDATNVYHDFARKLFQQAC